MLFTESALKAAHFIDLCCQRDIPLLFMADVTGFMVGRDAEQGGIAKAGAKLITAMASANVPKYTVIIGGSYGAGYLAMCGRAIQAARDVHVAQRPRRDHGPRAGGHDAGAGARADPAAQRPELDARPSARPSSSRSATSTSDFAQAYNFASRLWVDGVLDPLETRGALALLLEAASRTPKQETRFGVFRM